VKFTDDIALMKLVKTIKGIDKDRNGYITNQELEDILILCVSELKDANIVFLFKPFADPINKILVDYKQFLRKLKLDISVQKASEIREITSLAEQLNQESIHKLEVQQN